MEIEEAVAKIAKELGETDETPLTQLKGVAQALGAEHVLELLRQTKEIEEQGGMLVPDKSRRRTPGGVFFFLARRALTRDQKLTIFPQRPKPAAAPAAPRPRPRIIEVVSDQGKSKRTKFKPPELDDAVARARVRRKVSQTISTLSGGDQYQLLLDMLADLVEKAGSGSDSSPESSERAPKKKRASRSKA